MTDFTLNISRSIRSYRQDLLLTECDTFNGSRSELRQW